MNDFKKGTPAFGIALGLLFVVIGVLLLTLGFWKCLLLVCLFAVGYLLGAVDDVGAFFKTAANRVIPEKKIQVIDMKKEITREQADQIAAMREEAQKAPADMPEAAPQADPKTPEAGPGAR